MLKLQLDPVELIFLIMCVAIILLLMRLIFKVHSDKDLLKSHLEAVLFNQYESQKESSDLRFSSLKDSLSQALFHLQRNHQSSQMQLQDILNTQSRQQRKEQFENYRQLKGELAIQLGDIRSVVDEKLQKTLDQRLGRSSEMISQRLEIMHKGLGKLQTLAGGVDDLKRVLSNVKTRGVLGEVMLHNLLSEMFDRSQYAVNVVTKKGSQSHVEFAIKMPASPQQDLWLPLDSKFPVESAQTLLESRESGNMAALLEHQKIFAKAIESFAKSISLKYIDPPHTTPFALMFLPNESLFLEVMNCEDLFQSIQSKYKVTITGPTTLSAFLNSLQMGFHTLSIQKRSNEIMNHFLDLKKEFTNYTSLLSKAHKQVGSAYNSLSELEGVRLRAILRKFQKLEEGSGE